MKSKDSVAILVSIIIVIVSMGLFNNHLKHKMAYANTQDDTARVAASPTPTIQHRVGVKSSPTFALDQSPVRAVVVPQPEQDEIDAYVRTIFGSDAKVALAVQRVECNPKNKAYPRCVYHTKHEFSVGIFQINLFNANHWIHAKKVPGETMDEKIEWLKDPYHNTLIAYKIFTDSGFEPWAGYTSGRYLDHMGE